VCRENDIKHCAISNNGGKSLHEFYCEVLGIVVNVVSLMDDLRGAVRTLSNTSRIPSWKKYGIVVSINHENDAKVEKLAKDFDIPTKTLTTKL